jgi:hypothetical protein
LHADNVIPGRLRDYDDFQRRFAWVSSRKLTAEMGQLIDLAKASGIDLSDDPWTTTEYLEASGSLQEADALWAAYAAGGRPWTIYRRAEMWTRAGKPLDWLDGRALDDEMVGVLFDAGAFDNGTAIIEAAMETADFVPDSIGAHTLGAARSFALEEYDMVFKHVTAVLAQMPADDDKERWHYSLQRRNAIFALRSIAASEGSDLSVIDGLAELIPNAYHGIDNDAERGHILTLWQSVAADNLQFLQDRVYFLEQSNDWAAIRRLLEPRQDLFGKDDDQDGHWRRSSLRESYLAALLALEDDEAAWQLVGTEDYDTLFVRAARRAERNLDLLTWVDDPRLDGISLVDRRLAALRAQLEIEPAAALETFRSQRAWLAGLEPWSVYPLATDIFAANGLSDEALISARSTSGDDDEDDWLWYSLVAYASAGDAAGFERQLYHYVGSDWGDVSESLLDHPVIARALRSEDMADIRRRLHAADTTE